MSTPIGRFPLPRVLTSDRAAQLGLSESRVRTELRNGRWTRLTRGVYLTRTDQPTRTDWARAGLALGGPEAVVSGWDAVRRYGLASERPPSDDVLILTTGGANREVGCVRIRPSHRPVTRCFPSSFDHGFSPLPVPCAARAVADTALVYRWLNPVRAMVTASVQRGLCTPDQLAAELAAGPQNGSWAFRVAVEDVQGGAESIAEAEAADVLAGAEVPVFELNIPILRPDGTLIAKADVLWRELRAVLEVDSRQHHFLEPAWERTMRRHNHLTRRGLAVTHYPPSDFRRRPALIQQEVPAWLRARALELGRPFRPSKERPQRSDSPEPYILPF